MTGTAAKQQRIVITGLGTHGAGGTSPAQLWESTVRKIVRVDERVLADGRKCAVYPAPDPMIKVREAKLIKHADRSAKLALAAAKQAWESAHLGASGIDAQRVGVIIGSSRGPAGVALGGGSGRIRSFDAVYTAFSSIAGVIAAELGAARCAEMASATCISAAVALRTAMAMLRDGELDVAVVGGVDAPLIDSLMEQFATAGVLSDRCDAQALSPFDRNRTGTAVGEGAAFIIAETEEHAVARGAQICGVIRAVSTGCEPHLRTRMSMNAQGLQQTVRRALSACSLEPSAIDVVVLHGTGTRLNDLMESRCVRELFGDADAQPYSIGTKAITGHTLGAASMFQLLVGLESARHRFIPGTANCAELDPECPLRLSIEEGVSAEIRHGICLTSGFWGNTSCIVFGQAER